MDRQALREELQIFAETQEPFDNALWLVGDALVDLFAAAAEIRSDALLDPALLSARLQGAREKLVAGRTLLRGARGASPELMGSVERWIVIVDRIEGHLRAPG